MQSSQTTSAIDVARTLGIPLRVSTGAKDMSSYSISLKVSWGGKDGR